MRSRRVWAGVLALVVALGVGVWWLPTAPEVADVTRIAIDVPVAPVVRPEAAQGEPEAAVVPEEAVEADPSALAEAAAAFDGHVLVSCYVGEGFDVPLSNWFRGAIRDGWFHRFTTDLEGTYTHDLDTEPFTVRWSAPAYGQVAPCTVERLEMAWLELTVVDGDGEPVEGARARATGVECPDRTDSSGETTCEVVAGRPTHLYVSADGESAFVELPALAPESSHRVTAVLRSLLPILPSELHDPDPEPVPGREELCALYLGSEQEFQEQRRADVAREAEEAVRRREYLRQAQALGATAGRHPFLSEMRMDLERIAAIRPDPASLASLEEATEAWRSSIEDGIAENCD